MAWEAVNSDVVDEEALVASALAMDVVCSAQRHDGGAGMVAASVECLLVYDEGSQWPMLLLNKMRSHPMRFQ